MDRKFHLSCLFVFAPALVAQGVMDEARHLSCRVNAPTNLIFPSTTRITNAVAEHKGVQIAYKTGGNTLTVTARPAAEDSRLVISTAEGSTYVYKIEFEVADGKDWGAFNYSVWPLNDEQIEKVFEPEILGAIKAAPVRHYKVSYSSKKPTFRIQPTVGFDGRRTAFLLESPLNAAVLVYVGTKENPLPAHTVPLKFNRNVWISDRVSDHWYVMHENEWATVDVLP